MFLKLKQRRANKKYKNWQIEKDILEQEQKIGNERHDLKQKSWKSKISFSKKLMIFLFINFTILEIFTGWVTAYSFALAFATGIGPDFTPLVTLLGAVIGETVSYAIYCAKSKAENTSGGIIYETTLKDLGSEGEIESEDNAAG